MPCLECMEIQKHGSGDLTPFICPPGCTKLEVLDLSSNIINGTLPGSLSLTQLSQASFALNALTGVLRCTLLAWPTPWKSSVAVRSLYRMCCAQRRLTCWE